MNNTSNWHESSSEDTLLAMKSSSNGLSQIEANTRLHNNGPNRLIEVKRRSALVRFFLHFHNILIYVLLFSAFITSLLGHWIDTGVILLVVIANAIISFIQEGKAEKSLDAIRHMLAPKANVIRDGERITIDGEQLVPGDVVLLEPGDKVPADIRLITAHGLSIREAILTGESLPVNKQTDPVALNVSLGDRTCMAYSGTFVANGQAKGVVVATGSETEVGRISGLLSGVETLTTPLIKQMDIFAKRLTVFIVLVAIGLLAFSYFVTQQNFNELFMVVVGLTVAAIPEGLPAVLTITLAIGVQTMAQRNAIVRRLPAIETLGAVSVICTDKTGTLTRNEMMVASVLTESEFFTVDGKGYQPDGGIRLKGGHINPANHLLLEEIALTAKLCNDSALRLKNGIWSVEGDAMEGALLSFSRKVGLSTQQEQSVWSRTDVIPFDSKHLFMATLNHDHEKRAKIFVKGAPEQILKMCSNQLCFDGTNKPLDSDYWHEEAKLIASQGQRLLAFAVKSVSPEQTILEHNDVAGDLTLVGMVGMIDPPRSEAIEAVAECHAASIRVIMITGDHVLTAAAIGKQVGLNHSENVLTGNDLDALDDDSLRQAVVNCNIFARTTPEHKLRIVMALQANDNIVAMTGDGVNDAPALKRADAGIAMGNKGSEVAKEASELVLADDNFASIAVAVREGRTVYDNLTKVVAFMLPVNGGESISIIIALLIGLTLPIAPAQILWVNMIGSVILAITLAFSPADPEVMKRPPRVPSKSFLSPFVLWRVIFVSSLFAIGIFGQFELALMMGQDVEYARTLAVNTLITMEVFYLISMVYSGNTLLCIRKLFTFKPMLVSLTFLLFVQLLFIYAPFMQTIFDTQSLELQDLFLILASGFAVLLLIEFEKKVRSTLNRSGSNP